MAISWTAKKQMIFLAIFLLVIVIVIAIVFAKATRPTCFDAKQNQKEEGIDCGGPCPKKCLGEIKEPIVFWSKVFKIGEGRYDAVSLVQNPNIFLFVPSVKYQFKLYDRNNILIAVREGKTFFNSGETFPIFGANIDVGSRLPERVFIEIEKNIQWERLDKEREKPQLVVSKKDFFNTEPFPRLFAAIANKSIFNVDNVSAAAILYDKDKNAKGVSVTRIDVIPAGGSYEAVFTWPAPFSEEPALSEIFLRTEIK
ncbi:MAG: hypothetical protein HY773_01180 [Candidatus Terrybacteria bacterium]|nr:hypothetical protein [Candidatus Terrybacteria bacterium]